MFRLAGRGYEKLLMNARGPQADSQREPEFEPRASWRTTYLGADTSERADNSSWGSIVAGVIVALATFVTFSLVGASLGLGITDPTSDEPFAGVGLAVGLWSVLTLAVSLAAGGFVAGVLAVRAGFLHGLVVWAASTLALVVAVVLAVQGILGVGGAIVGSVGSAVGGQVGSLADVAGDAVGATAEGIADQVGDADFSGLTDDVRQVLADTDVPELQPEYLEDQIEEARDDIVDAAGQLVTDPAGYEEVLDELATSLQERVEVITDSVDRDAIAAAVAANTELSGPEAEEAVDNAVEGAQRAAAGAGDAIAAAQAALTDAQDEVGQLVEDARQTLDDAADASARAALWTFIGLLIGAAIASFAGLWGSRLVIARTESGRVRTPTEDIDRA